VIRIRNKTIKKCSFDETKKVSNKESSTYPIISTFNSGVVTAQNKISKDDIESIVATSLDVPGLYTRLAHLGHLYS
jgi:hypothetical protein